MKEEIMMYRFDVSCTMGGAIVPLFRLLGGQARPLHQ